jgi:hypothetical protein
MTDESPGPETGTFLYIKLKEPEKLKKAQQKTAKNTLKG